MNHTLLKRQAPPEGNGGRACITPTSRFRGWGTRILLILCWVTGWSSTASASHFAGGQITYTAQGNNQYQVTLTLYRDCSGINFGASQTLNITPTSGGASMTVTEVSRTSITPLCPGQTSNCNAGGNTQSIQEIVYRATRTFLPTTGGYRLAFTGNARNGIITTGAANTSWYIHCTGIGATGTPNNNSPQFLNPPIAYLCVNQQASISPNASDPDGDALVYSLTPCSTSASALVPYVAGLSGSNPLFTSSGFSLNPSTGVLTFTPNQIQVGVVCLKVEEFRNGVKIGEVIRDLQVAVRNCNNACPVISALPNVVVQPNQTFCTNITVTDANNTTITLTATSSIIPPATFTVTSSVPGTSTATFCWTPGLVHAGNTYTVSIIANDNACPQPCVTSLSFNITVPVPCNMTATATGTDETILGLNNGTASVTITNGTAPFQYSWSGPGGYTAFSQNISGLAPGSYSVTVVDGNSCVATASVTINPGINPVTLTGISNNVTCNGACDGSITLTPSGGTAPYTYTLNGGAGQATNTFTGLCPGTYVANVSDANGSTATATFLISEPPALLLTTGNLTVGCGYNISCHGGSDGSAFVTATGGIPPYLYQWSSGQNQPSVSGVPAGTYTVTVTDVNGCTATASITLTQPELLSGTATSSLYNCGYNVSCNGAGDGSIDLSMSGGCAPYSYNWSNGASTQDVSGLMAGSYTVVVTDANGCTFTASYDLSEPALLTASAVASTFNCGNNVSCNGASDGSIDLSMSGGCAPYSYSWSNGSTAEDPSGLSAGTYSVVVTDANGCSATASVSLSEPAALASSGTVSSYNCGYNVSCNGASDGSINFTVTGGCAPYSYSWSNGSTVEDPSGLGAGTYTVMVTDANGCLTTNSFTLTQPTAVTVNAGPNVTVYYGYTSQVGCTTLNATGIGGGCGPYTILWSNGTTTASNNVCPSSTTTYTVTVTDANGCTGVDEVIVCVVDLRCTGNSNNGQGGNGQSGNGVNNGQGGGLGLTHISICHFPPGNPNNGMTKCIPQTAVAHHLGHGDYLGACGTNVPCAPGGKTEAPATSGMIQSLSVAAFPTPTSGHLTVEVNCEGCGNAADLRVTDVLGREITRLAFEMNEGRFTTELNLGAESDGIYFVIVRSGDKTVTTKVVKD